MAQTRPSRIKMSDVARESGVSLSTVSMVFGNKPGLPAETRQKVLKTASRLGYAPRQTATVSQPGAVRCLGVAVRARPNEVSRHDQFYAPVVAGIESACRQNKFKLVYTSVHSDLENRPLETPHLFDEDGVDGVLLVGVYLDDELCQVIKRYAVPVVLVDSYAACDEFDNVVSDNFKGAYQATCHLIGKGHRKIGFIGGATSTYPSFAERRKGYLQALHDHQIGEAFFADCRSVREEVIESVRNLLLQHPDLTALVGANDFVAITAMHVALELGRQVGKDLSLVGYDDILLAESVIPPLTTMQIDKLAMGRTAVQLLMNRAAQPDFARITATMSAHLVERNSVCVNAVSVEAAPDQGLVNTAEISTSPLVQ